jgi:hypothetical protein
MKTLRRGYSGDNEEIGMAEIWNYVKYVHRPIKDFFSGPLVSRQTVP